MRTSRMLALGMVATGAVAAFALWERWEKPALDVREREPTATAERAERALEAERVRGALARLARDQASAEPPALPEIPSPLPGAAEKPDPDPDPYAAPARPAPPSSAVYMAHLGNAFADETIDPAWSRRATEVVATR